MANDFGTLISAKDALVTPDINLGAGHDEADISQFGTALWEYKDKKTINGVPVLITDTNLPIDRDDVLMAAFELITVPKSQMFWMSPDIEHSTDKYDALLKEVANGSVIISEETSQYDANKQAFIVWVKYTEVYYKLNSRFEYIRGEIQ